MRVADWSRHLGTIPEWVVDASLVALPPLLALVAEGLTNDEIGQRLFMSPVTARTHVSRAMVKLGARDRAQLVVLAYRAASSRRLSATAAPLLPPLA